ncbi:flagellar hook-length control protein FliK [Roseomonas sp. SSH11]|uniref:Flagellar hook-length control protein FliK n=1 Tax=Pararoseomonas baculiformis TaxID=2820812 RepID=A0ABS4AKH8_9PROT|nr:flagellar hook-length control protein FliK [Pararoseomonas baculiformis]MBP0447386.1 flagellar hook-length control protein FliK [Pararoseomonas baculiformis]
MLASLYPTCSAPAPALDTESIHVNGGTDDRRFSEVLNGALKGPTHAKEKALEGVRGGSGARQCEPDLQEVAPEKWEAIENDPAFLAGRQEVPSQNMPSTEPAGDEGDGLEQGDNVTPVSAAHLAEGSAAVQAVSSLTEQPALPEYVSAVASQRMAEAPASKGGMPDAEMDRRGARIGTDGIIGLAGSAAVSPGTDASADGEVTAATEIEDAIRPSPGLVHAQPLANSIGAPAAGVGVSLPSSTLPAAVAPAPMPAEARGYAGAFVPSPPAQQISPAILSLSAQSGRHQVPSRLVVALQPGGLGRVEITMEQVTNRPAEVCLCAERPETLHMLMRDTDAIQAVLQQAGVGGEGGRNLSFSLFQGGSGHQSSPEQEARQQPGKRHSANEGGEATRMPLAAAQRHSLSLNRIDIAV